MTLHALEYWAIRLHVVPGAVAMIVAPAAMLVTKGGWWHRLWGRIFVWSIFVALLAAVPLAYFANDLFLFYMTFVIFFLTLSGYRIHIIKRQNYRGGLIDWIGVAVMALAGVGATRLGLSTGSEMGFVMLIVGLLPPRAVAPPQAGVVVHPHGQDALRVRLRGHRGICGPVPLAADHHSLALAHGHRGPRYVRLEPLLPQSVPPFRGPGPGSGRRRAGGGSCSAMSRRWWPCRLGPLDNRPPGGHAINDRRGRP